MNNFLKRLTLTLIAVPVLFFSLFWPVRNHIVIISVFGLIITYLGSYEFFCLIFKKGINVKRFFLPVINSVIYFFSYFYVNNFLNLQKIKAVWIFFIFYLIIIISFVYARDILKNQLTRSLERAAYTVLGILYLGIPSFFVPFLFNISDNPVNPVPVFYNIESSGTITGSFLALLFMILVFSSDIFSYLFGMLFGRKNVIHLEASPKKSWAGYIGGFFSTYFWVAIFYLLFNYLFTPLNYPIWFYLIITTISGFLVPIGDLVESVFKRSANIKDSGNLIMGRGGVLDSVDTIVFFLPFYFMYIQFYYILTF
jgi:phosphatidate cytidylyltransferase